MMGYVRCALTDRIVKARVDALVRETQQADVTNTGTEWRLHYVRHATYGLNISPIEWIKQHSSRVESELLLGRGNEGRDNVPLPNTTGSSGLVH